MFPPEHAWVPLQGGPCHYNARNCRICQNRYQASVIHLIPPRLVPGCDILPYMNTDTRRRRKPIRRNSTISDYLRHGTPWELQLQRPWWDLTTALDLHPLSLLWPWTQERRWVHIPCVPTDTSRAPIGRTPLLSVCISMPC